MTYDAAPRETAEINVIFAVLLLMLLMLAVPQAVTAQMGSKRFTVADDIALTQPDSAIKFSPDGRYCAVVSDRGRLDVNRVESALRVYRLGDVASFLSHPEMKGEIAYLWIITKATYKNGPIIGDVRWLPDSNGLVFLAKTTAGNDQLFLADIHARAVEPLTQRNQHVTGFDVHSKREFVYTVLSPAIPKKAIEDTKAGAIEGMGRSIYSLLFPGDETEPNVLLRDLSELWAVVDGKRFRVEDRSSHHPVPIHIEGERALALSPDGRSVVTALTIADVPAEWETLYPPQVPAYPYKVRAGPQDPEAFSGKRHLSEYVLIDLYNKKAKRLTKAPIGNEAGWWAGYSRADWSADGRAVVLSNTFLPLKKWEGAARANSPCAVVADLATGDLTCLDPHNEEPGSRSSKAWQPLVDPHFIHGNRDMVMGTYSHHGDTPGHATFLRQANGSWKANLMEGAPAANTSLEICIKQSINDPPILMASNTGAHVSRVIWNPNPQLKDIKLGKVSVFKWKDKTGREWVGGLYKPPNYDPATRYPLIIQTHGFDQNKFSPNGVYPTAFAAQELAAVGFVVLQVKDCPIRADPEEGPCQVAGYESAVQQLNSDGLVDKDRMGIIGFSRTCYYVLETLTTSALHFKAALIADGVNEGYLQYMLNVDHDSVSSIAREADAMIGVPPFGPGLNQWLTHSPEFNMDKVTTPLQVVATARASVLLMWEPYAALRYLRRPVDLVILNSSEHVFTNPAERLISQGGTVDWFRFWLKGEEDPDPTKAEQYARWRELKKLQAQAPEKRPK